MMEKKEKRIIILSWYIYVKKAELAFPLAGDIRGHVNIILQDTLINKRKSY